MSRLPHALLTILTLAALAACNGGSPSASPSPTTASSPTLVPSLDPGSSPTTPPTATPSLPDGTANLLDREWLLTLVGEGAISPDPPITITFGAGGQVSGSGGCNAYGGDYTLEGGSLSIGDVFSTKMACIDPTASQNESAFLAALATVQTWGIADAKLVLSGPQGTDPLVFESQGPVAPPTGLVGPTWVITKVGEADMPLDAGITATFDDTGTVFGSGGCNEYSGSYGLDGDLLTFGGLATTEMACEAPVGPREASFYQAVAVVAGWQIVDGELELLDSSGVTIIWLTPTR